MAHAARITDTAFTRCDQRLASGRVLPVYVTAHLVNHALGLVSVAFDEAGLRIVVGVWHSLLGTQHGRDPIIPPHTFHTGRLK